jgi:hypothetical protein
MFLSSNAKRLAIAAAWVALSGCSRACDGGSSADRADSGGTASATAATLRPRAANARTPRLDAAKTTREILTELSPDCLSCAEKNGCLDPAQRGGITCETVEGVSKVSGQAENALCLDTLRCIFTSKCANSTEESECVCGKTSISSCLDGSEAPVGTCIAEYRRDYGPTADGKFLAKEFVNPAYGAGAANMLIQCVMPQCPTCRIP